MTAAVVDDRDPDSVAARQREVQSRLRVMSVAVEHERAAIDHGARCIRTGGATRIDTAGQLLLAALLDRIADRDGSTGDVRRAAAALAQHIVHRGPR